MLFLGHNFRTRNAIKPMKWSKDSDYSLVCIKNLSQKFPLAVGSLGQNGLKLTQLWQHSQKNP